MEFKNYRDEMMAHFKKNMEGNLLLRTAATSDEMWACYLGAFEPGMNPIYRERTQHDCSACRHFIRDAGNMVAVVGHDLVSLWDFVPSALEVYGPVNRAMSRLVKSHAIHNLFLTGQRRLGIDVNYEQAGGKDKDLALAWHHLTVTVPASVVVTPGDKLVAQAAKHQESASMLFRALSEISLDASREVIDLIKQNSLYRGEEHRKSVEDFHALKALYLAQLATDPHPADGERRASEILVWRTVATSPGLCRIRNTVIGTLLTDLSEGKDLESAVSAYESKVAPHNYKRPRALITKTMVERASRTMDELGYKSALARRHARLTDLTVNNMLFVDRESRMIMDPFEALAADLPVGDSALGKIEEITAEKFVQDVLPGAVEIEVLFENRHVGNLVSLIAPHDPDAKTMFRWPNNFSWCYNGEVADSIKERVKQAGGDVTGFFRASLSWFNFDDLDLSVVEPDGNRIYFRDKRNPLTGGQLDVDMNAGGKHSRQPVENITFPRKDRMQSGKYQIWVHQFSKRENIDTGFEVEIEINGETMNFGYAQPVHQDQRILVAEMTWNALDGKYEIIPGLKPQSAQREVWGLKTGTFHKVRLVTMSPNCWGGKEEEYPIKFNVGNRHYFFILDKCATTEPARGFFNEFLRPELNEHRKVFEILAGRMTVAPVPEQLSGLGFSTTKRDNLTVMVRGSFRRMLNIRF